MATMKYNILLLDCNTRFLLWIVTTLRDVRRVLDLKRHLISLSTLDSKGYKYIGEGGVLKVSKCVLVVMKWQKRTPQEVWSGTLASYSNLNIFGCPAYAHVDNGKLEARSIKCVFISYKSGVKGYKLWCPETKKVIEMESLHKNDTWNLVRLPKGKNVVRCKWVFKRKEGIPRVEEANSIRALLGIVTMHDFELEQLDVKTTFLHGELEEDIYM
ncbi:hypothetical protein AAG906_015341 [Vitis piasezkii]